MKKGVIILGSSNSHGETYKLCNSIQQYTHFPIIDLRTKNILPFDYEFKNQEDDFLNTFRTIVDNYELIIFATPVYWYAMSGTMKIFFDRFSDCLKRHKELGRKLRGKQMALLSVGSDKEIKEGFTMPFVETANYLGMHYITNTHLSEDATELEKNVALQNFVDQLNQFQIFLQ
ncbi:MAG: flavodoxin family protein [Saprospiraceae bacterium]|nr:flavodoxin family protein [Saprospiraceae bacterium]HMW40316.1 flavodoxin family protein [Saprospiraceae bacterium]HMX88873.1 flavodoxin family protein [Saprospiraceae bacterium]HMZ40998.1 flavodoxin family protein [Saprospiraceae bacterium]HNA64375.1 flavodoxin family protein [Saprospiraceae bacterium]